MARMQILRESISTIFQDRQLWLAQFFLNPLLALLFALWLQIPEAQPWQLLLSLLFALAIAIGVLVLHGGTLNFTFERSAGIPVSLKAAFKSALRHVFALLVWALIFYLLWSQIDRLQEVQDQLATYLRSEFPAWLRRAVSPQSLTNWLGGFIFALYWIVLPGLLLPLALQCAQHGFRGFAPAGLRNWGHTLKSLSYWIVMICAAILGVYVPGKIMEWTMNPQTATLRGETISLIFRLLLAYVLGLLSWIALCSTLGRAALPETAVAGQTSA